MSKPLIRVEVVYALPLAQELCRLEVEDGTGAGEAIALSGITRRHPEIDLAHHCVSIFGRLVTLQTALRDRDRVEILRPLTVDPNVARRRRRRRERG